MSDSIQQEALTSQHKDFASRLDLSLAIQVHVPIHW
jgi:hypothetical protein